VAALNHPNIVAVYDVGENFLVRELVDGQTLRAGGQFSQRKAIRNRGDCGTLLEGGRPKWKSRGIFYRDNGSQNGNPGLLGDARPPLMPPPATSKNPTPKEPV
jgi:hypothetical protein